MRGDKTMKIKYKINQRFYWGDQKKDFFTIKDIYVGKKDNLYHRQSQWGEEMVRQESLTKGLNTGEYTFTQKEMIQNKEKRAQKTAKKDIKRLQKRIKYFQEEIKRLTELI